MTRWAWVLMGLVGCMACAGCGKESNSQEMPEQRKQRLQECIVAKVPPPTGASQTSWTTSAYAVVGAYRSCNSLPGEATSADFREVMQGFATLDEDPTRVKLTRPGQSAP
ncbi:hypothetical protein NVS55_13765 [Myxococcus stipitatus]|uniref:hypothetical protein n=1 Tax=Myxococcus stipitatus TaxID=83455 RepID=UPI0031454EAD